MFAANMSDVMPLLNSRVNFGIVITCIKAKILLRENGVWALDSKRLKSKLSEQEVVAISWSENDGERNAMFVGKQAAIGAGFTAMFVGWASQIAAKRSNDMTAIHRLPLPMQMVFGIIALQRAGPQLVKKVKALPQLQAIVNGAFGSEIAR